jgi:glucose/arabinose dehydrogenase
MDYAVNVAKNQGEVMTYKKKIITGNYIYLIISVFLFIACQSQSQGINQNETGITVPAGFKAEVFADDLGRARHIVVNENGDLYVALQRKNKDGGIVALRDTNGDGEADVIKYFGDYNGTGIDIYKGYLYFGSDTEIVRYKLDEGKLVPSSEPEIIVTGFGRQSQHAAKSFDFDDSGNMYVNVGAPANACQEQTRAPGSPGMDPCPLLEFHGGIWRFQADQPGQDQRKVGYRFATGIRNAVALAWNPMVKTFYVVQHGRDQLSQLWPEYFTDEQSAELPAEEFFLVKDGMNFGWPYSYYDQIQGKKVLAPEYGGDGKKTDRCENFEKPIMAFPGHWAPNDLHFYTGNQFPDRYKGGAFIAFHGSWNRAPLEQRGYKVVFVPFDGAHPAGSKWEDFATGFPGKKVINSPGEARYRPMGLDEGPDGSLYISDSVKGRIWKVTYTGN